MARHLWIAWQPIIEFRTGRIIAQEALLRGPRGSNWESAASIFGWAFRTGHSDRLESAARRLAFSSSSDVPEHQILSINTNLSNPDIPLNPWRMRMENHQVAIEISEQQPIVDFPGVANKVKEWHEQGHLIVLDDYGTGYSALGAFLTLRPDWIKLDRRIIHNVDRDDYQFRIVRDVVSLFRDLGIVVVAEGVETMSEFEVLSSFGITYGQGFLFSPPGSVALRTLPEEIMRKLWGRNVLLEVRDHIQHS